MKFCISKLRKNCNSHGTLRIQSKISKMQKLKQMRERGEKLVISKELSEEK